MANKRSKEEAKEYIIKAAKEHDVKFIWLWFTDILGILKSFAITVEELEGAMEEGMGFDGSSIEGFARIDESDMVALPDPDTWQLLPWTPPEHRATARMFCDVLRPGGEPFEGDPRFVLKKNLKKAADLGYTFYVGPELEYFYFKQKKDDPGSFTTEFLDQGGYFDLTTRDAAIELRRDTVLQLEKMGIGCEYSHHEVADSQHEIDMRYTDALTMADSVMTYRLVVKEVALKNGVYATFMPKPIFGINGSGMHVHQSLFKGEKNAFFNSQDSNHLSKEARCYIAGLLKHAPEITAICNQWVNSYKRLVPGYEAPVYLSWARRNRSDLIRVPEDPIEENVYEMTEEERQERGIGTLPGSLAEAIQLAENSELVKKALGDHVFNSFIENKKKEWDNYRTQVTEYELQRYLPIL
jgi:glutamine synthetase